MLSQTVGDKPSSDWGYWAKYARGFSQWCGGYATREGAKKSRDEYQMCNPEDIRQEPQCGRGDNPFEAKSAVAVDPLKVTPAERISVMCDGIKAMLLDKNNRYGNSALEPQRIASRCSPEEGLLVRIDDKLSRWKTSAPGEDEDIVKDLIGYLIMLRISRQK